MHQETFSRSCLVVLAGLIFLILSGEMVAQPQEGDKKTERQAAKIIKLPTGFKTINVNGDKYYYHRGVFYQKTSTGYVVVRGPLGARINELHPGFCTVYVGAVPYYYYFGTYYRYDPVHLECIVMKPPEDAGTAEDVSLDRLTLIDGEILKGVYLGGSRGIVEFEISGEMHKIPVSEIVNIMFAPPASAN